MNKLLQRVALMAVFWVFIMAVAVGQRTISGRVTDDSGEAMIGVNILVVGTSTGTVSDFDGGYTLNVPEGATQLQFSYTGYERVLVDLGTTNQVDVVMGEGAILEDVVVTGYGTVKRENVTGSIQTVKKEDFNKGSITSVQELISGKVAGVQVVPSGEPGGSSVIRIRGGSSLSAINDPLVIIDGIPVSSTTISGSRNNLNIVNPNDIETVTVLKDASATAIYGSRASNGVIIITTKKGNLNHKLGLEYNGSVATSSATETADVLSADEFRGLINSRYGAGSTQSNILGTANTDWQNEILQDGFAHDHNLSLSGALGEIPFRLSGGYTDKDGLIKTDNFNRLSYGINLNPGFMDNKLQLNLSARGMTDKNHFADQGALGAAAFFDPTQPIRDEGSPYGGFFTWVNTDGTPNTLSPSNPVALLEQTDNNSTVNRYILGAQIDYRLGFFPDMRANLNLGYDHSKGEGEKFIPTNAAFAFYNNGRDENYTQENKNELLEFFLNYNKNLNTDFGLDVMGGYSWQHFHYDNFFVATDADRVDTITAADRNLREYYLLSLFGRVNLNLFDKFLLTFTVRRDGSSIFSEDNRWGTFPGAAFAWKIFENQPGALSELKFRVGYGLTGQQDLNRDNFYPYLPRYSSSTPTAQYPFGNTYYTTLRPEGYDANLKWEETTTFNVGFDYGFFGNRLNGSVEYYERKTKDLINFVPVAAGTNLTNFLLTNVGDLENKGVEFSINTVPWRKGKNQWTLGFNGAFNHNEITKLTATDDPNYLGVFVGGTGGAVGNTIQIHSVGHPANSFFVWEQVYDAAGVPIEGLYVDRNGDGVVNNADMYQYKKAAPDATFGFYTALDLGKFDFSAGARASAGNYVYNNNLANQAIYGYIYNSAGGGGGYLNNVNAQTQALDITSPQYFSDYYVQDGSFFKIDHLTAGYDFGGLGKTFTTLRISATVQNPLIITNYEGIDPEIATRDINNVVTPGIDNNIYPRSRTFLFGLSLGF